VVGFGQREVGKENSVGDKQVAPVPILTARCNGAANASDDTCRVGELSAGRLGTGDTCKGDSGGPLYIMSEGRPLLIAITSRGIGATMTCGVGGFYERLDSPEAQRLLAGVLPQG
jgi:secreted trypsin-like serine protease